MISITVLSLPPDAVQRLVNHTARDDTICLREERITACAFTLAAGLAALVVALVAGCS